MPNKSVVYERACEQSHGVLKKLQNAEVRAVQTSITAATQWQRYWTQLGRIESRGTVRTLSILKTNTVIRRSLGVLIERRGDAVRSPKRRSKVSYNAIGAPWAHTRVVVKTLWSSVAFARRLHGVLGDVTASSTQWQRCESAAHAL